MLWFRLKIKVRWNILIGDTSILTTIELDRLKNGFVEKVMVLKYKGLNLDT